MPKREKVPETASVAEQGVGDRLCAPSSERNTAPILALITEFAPAQGRVLEIASGTGQHVAAFAAALPALDWQPSDVDETRHDSIRAWAGGITNIRPVIKLDATAPGWSATQRNYDLIVVVNLLHLISEKEARTLIIEMAQALSPGGHVILYGPFMRAGELTSEGDERFHASLIEADPEIGYKDDFDVIDWLHGAGLSLRAVIEMPANNLGLVAERAN